MTTSTQNNVTVNSPADLLAALSTPDAYAYGQDNARREAIRETVKARFAPKGDNDITRSARVLVHLMRNN